MTIGEETAAHHGGIRRLLGVAFDYAAEADLVDELRAGGHVVTTLVAEDQDGIAGYVLFSDLDVEIAGRTIPSVALAPLAVREDCRNQGLGARLVREGLERCRRAGKTLAVVLGDPGYYGRFGFSVEAAHGLDSPFDGPALQVLELEAGTRGSGSGRIVYPPPFDRFATP